MHWLNVFRHFLIIEIISGAGLFPFLLQRLCLIGVWNLFQQCNSWLACTLFIPYIACLLEVLFPVLFMLWIKAMGKLLKTSVREEVGLMWDECSISAGMNFCVILSQMCRISTGVNSAAEWIWRVCQNRCQTLWWWNCICRGKKQFWRKNWLFFSVNPPNKKKHLDPYFCTWFCLGRSPCHVAINEVILTFSKVLCDL